jgi:NAD(P)-dependent dehydrogenase (short-subunit alcohol dehydrogenase family)
MAASFRTAAVSRLFKQVETEFGSLDIFVNDAAEVAESFCAGTQLESIVILLYTEKCNFGHFYAVGVAASCMAWRLEKEYSSFSKRRTKIAR